MITAALARLHRNRGRRVRVFKHGPDYLDPMVLEQASGAPVYQLHPWMTGEAECQWRLAAAAEQADLVLVEGSMGLFDGNPSSADLAVLMGLPVIPVISAAAMAQTFGALVKGLATYRPDVQVREVIANRIGSERHAAMLRESLPEDIALWGAVPRHEALSIPDRHLGLFQAGEIANIDAQLDAAAEVLAEAGLDRLPEPVTLQAKAPVPYPPLLQGVRIAIARDFAFAFLYRANLEMLEGMGAELCFFSMLDSPELPAVDALWLPGGYPELHAEALSNNSSLRASIRTHHEQGKPILAECGGLMACMEELVDGDGRPHTMLGLLPGRAKMAGKLVGLGLQSLTCADGELRGHAFHHSLLETPLKPVLQTRRQRFSSIGEAVFTQNGLVATYFHLYFPSCPSAVARIFTEGVL